MNTISRITECESCDLMKCRGFVAHNATDINYKL